MLCARSTCPSTQLARTSACIAEIHIQAFKHRRGTGASQDWSLKENRNGRVLQAHAKIRPRAEFLVGKYEWIESKAHLDSCARPKNVVTSATPTWNFVMAGHRPVPQITGPPFRVTLLWEWTLVEWWATVFTKNSILPKFLVPCVLTSTAGYTKVLFSMENAQIMLEMAAKCSNYAKNSGLCFLFWIILFEADYAKNYASILYQCLPLPPFRNALRLENNCELMRCS